MRRRGSGNISALSSPLRGRSLVPRWRERQRVGWHAWAFLTTRLLLLRRRRDGCSELGFWHASLPVMNERDERQSITSADAVQGASAPSPRRTGADRRPLPSPVVLTTVSPAVLVYLYVSLPACLPTCPSACLPACPHHWGCIPAHLLPLFQWYAAGKCRFGDKCRNYHDPSVCPPAPREGSGSGGGRVGSSPNASTTTRKSRREPRVRLFPLPCPCLLPGLDGSPSWPR